MKIGNTIINKSEKKKFQAGLVEGYGLCGAYQGKTLVITAGVHGGEYVGIETARRLIRELNPKELHGNVIICPILNFDSFYHGIKQMSPVDNKNLNREFPGDERGTKTEKIAFDVEKYLYPLADFIIDLHGGDINEKLTPLIFFPCGVGDEMAEYVKDIASRLSVPYRVRSLADNGLYSYAAKKNIPAMLYERGDHGIWSEADVEAEKEDLYRLMEILGIIKKGYNTQINETQKEIVEARYIPAGNKGLWYPNFKNGDNIKKGEVLGVLKDMEGEVCQNVAAEFDGSVLYYTLSLGVVENDVLVAYGRE